MIQSIRYLQEGLRYKAHGERGFQVTDALAFSFVYRARTEAEQGSFSLPASRENSMVDQQILLCLGWKAFVCLCHVAEGGHDSVTSLDTALLCFSGVG